MADPKKLLQAYTEISTPKELFLDLVERIEKSEQLTEEVKGELLKEVNEVKEQLSKNNLNLETIGQYFDDFTSKVDPLFNRIDNIEEKILTPNELVKTLQKEIPKYIPEPVPGKDGTEIEPKDVRDKLKELKGNERLSVFDLKDTEWLRSKGKEKMQWNAVGVPAPVTVAPGLTLSGIYTQTGTISNLNTLTLLNSATVVLSFAINGQAQHLTADYIFSGTTVTYTTPLDASFTGLNYTIVYA